MHSAGEAIGARHLLGSRDGWEDFHFPPCMPTMSFRSFKIESSGQLALQIYPITPSPRNRISTYLILFFASLYCNTEQQFAHLAIAVRWSINPTCCVKPLFQAMPRRVLKTNLRHGGNGASGVFGGSKSGRPVQCRLCPVIKDCSLASRRSDVFASRFSCPLRLDSPTRVF